MPMMGTVRSWDAAASDSTTCGEVAEAVGILRLMLGEHWKGWETGAPLATFFHTTFQGGPREWVRLGRLIHALEDAPNRHSMVRRDLGADAWTQYTAAVMALEFCGRLRLTGRAVEFIQTTDRKGPDARICLAGRWVTLEFKALHETDEMEPWHELQEWVYSQFCVHGMDLGGLEVDCAMNALTKDHRAAFAGGLLAVKTSQSPDYQELPQQTGRARVIDGNMGHWLFPVKQVSELERIVGKLARKWWKQLRGATTPTVIVIRTCMLFGETQESVTIKAEAAATRLREVLESFDVVGAILIYDEILWQPPSPAFLGHPDFRLSIGAVDGCARAALIVPNHHASTPLDAVELETLVGPTMLW